MDIWLEKLDRQLPLTEAEAQGLRATFSTQIEFAAGKPVLQEGKAAAVVGAVLEGLLIRCRWTPEGQRQILGLIVPGDLVEPQGFLLGSMDHSIVAKTSVRIAVATARAVATLTERHPRLRDDFVRSTLIAASAHREWIVNCGQRSGHARVAHLLSEWIFRFEGAVSDRDVEMPFPLSQIDIADAVGLSSVHVNRILQAMRVSGLAVIKSGTLRAPDGLALWRTAGFDPAYLHASRREDPSRHVAALSGGLPRVAPWLHAEG